jgi:hypothetical protein
MVWDKNFPQNTDQIKNAPPDFQANWAALEDTFAADHNIPGASSYGEHKKITFTAPIAKPTGSANKAILYPKDDSGGKVQLFAVDEDDNDYQITYFSDANIATLGTNTTYSGANSGGWTFLPGGLILFYGSYALPNPAAGITIAYPFSFPSGGSAYCIQVSSNTSNTIRWGSSTSSGFTPSGYPSTGSGNILTWMAIGK